MFYLANITYLSNRRISLTPVTSATRNTLNDMRQNLRPVKKDTGSENLSKLFIYLNCVKL